MRKILAALLGAALLSTLALTGTAAANVPGEVSAVTDNGLANVGVIHAYHGACSCYAAGPYDGLLAVGERTDVKWGWGRADAVFLSTQECATISRRDINRPDLPFIYVGKVGPVGGPTWHLLGDGFLWDVHRWTVGSGRC